MARHRLSDDQWALIASFFPPRKRTGRRPVDRRRVVDGILWILNTGAPWRDLPGEFGSHKTVWRYLMNGTTVAFWRESFNRCKLLSLM